MENKPDSIVEPSVREYVDQVAAMLNLSLQPEHRPGVIMNFERIQTIAQQVTEFPLPEDIEIAPIFQP